MNILEQLAKNQPSWSLEEFVQITNNLLPQFLPAQKGNTRVREEVTPRLIRHYTTLGMLDEPLKDGRYAVYTYRHLLQILVVRRLLAEGFGANAIDQLATQRDNTELENLLAGGVQLSVTTANPALAYLQQIQNQRSSVSVSPAMPAPTIRQANPKTEATTWIRLEILPGLEIHVRDDFSYPNSQSEQQNLMQYIAQKLKDFAIQKRK
ncbi:MerR family transcriptional regulator [Cyanobacteria bacterium FACHB-472]|nr:MerR family transcriptional regulator [Cyanobacteria bacterium FACHB-472]